MGLLDREYMRKKQEPTPPTSTRLSPEWYAAHNREGERAYVPPIKISAIDYARIEREKRDQERLHAEAQQRAAHRRHAARRRTLIVVITAVVLIVIACVILVIALRGHAF